MQPLYVIRQTRQFYGPSDIRSLVAHGNGRAVTFETAKAARDAIKELESGRHYFVHNECARPEYKVMRIDRLPQYLAQQV